MSLKIYLYTDLEGVAGVDHWDARWSDRPDEVRRRREVRELLMGHVNAAAEGAFAAGAAGAVLVEGHADSIIYELADQRLEIIKGAALPTWLPDLDAGCGAAFFVGAHAMAGTAGATLPHSFSQRDRRRWWLCGREIGEFGAFAAICGAHGVPVALAVGDDKLCAEARELVPEVETAQVKAGLAPECARHESRERACELVRMAALRAAERAIRGEIRPWKPPGPPYVARVWSRTRRLYLPLCEKPGERCLSPYEIEYSGNDLLEVMRRVTY